MASINNANSIRVGKLLHYF